MTLASHNTMTYLKPRKWWMWFGRFMAKCQSKSIEEQYKAGARWFDLRIALIKPNKNDLHYPYFAHGAMSFKGDIENTLAFLNSKKDAYCRIVLEKGNAAEEEIFKYFVIKWKGQYPNLKITQIAKKGVWGNMMEATAKMPKSMVDCYASSNGYYAKYDKLPGILHNKVVSGYLIDDLWPWIYAKLHNKKNIKKYKNEDIFLLIDFV